MLRNIQEQLPLMQLNPHKTVGWPRPHFLWKTGMVPILVWCTLSMSGIASMHLRTCSHGTPGVRQCTAIAQRTALNKV